MHLNKIHNLYSCSRLLAFLYDSYTWSSRRYQYRRRSGSSYGRLLDIRRHLVQSSNLWYNYSNFRTHQIYENTNFEHLISSFEPLKKAFCCLYVRILTQYADATCSLAFFWFFRLNQKENLNLIQFKRKLTHAFKYNQKR